MLREVGLKVIKTKNNMEKEHMELVKKISGIEKILQHLLAVELYKFDVSQKEIGKHIGIATGSVNKLLKGIKKQK